MWTLIRKVKRVAFIKGLSSETSADKSSGPFLCYMGKKCSFFWVCVLFTVTPSAPSPGLISLLPPPADVKSHKSWCHCDHCHHNTQASVMMMKMKTTMMLMFASHWAPPSYTSVSGCSHPFIIRVVVVVVSVLMSLQSNDSDTCILQPLNNNSCHPSPSPPLSPLPLPPSPCPTPSPFPFSFSPPSLCLSLFLMNPV